VACLFGLQESNPVDVSRSYGGRQQTRTAGRTIRWSRPISLGGVNFFGGGLALYTKTALLGVLGVMGDTSCTYHPGLEDRDALKAGQHQARRSCRWQADNIIYDTQFAGTPTRAVSPTPLCSHPQWNR